MRALKEFIDEWQPQLKALERGRIKVFVRRGGEDVDVTNEHKASPQRWIAEHQQLVASP